MNLLSFTAALVIACPQCAAAPGALCRDGKRVTRTHAVRLAATSAIAARAALPFQSTKGRKLAKRPRASATDDVRRERNNRYMQKRRARLTAAGRCLNHMERTATHGVRCRECAEQHGGYSSFTRAA